MRSAAIIAGLCLALCTGAATAGETRPPRDSVLLFVASWCAPCHGEVRDLAVIAEAAAPMRVFVVPIDAARGTDRMMARVPDERRWRLPPAAATALMRRLAGGAPGLPTSVAINGEGAVCAVTRVPLSPAQAAAIKRRCIVRDR